MIRINGLTKTYNNGDAPLYALRDVSFEIADNDFVVILGPSGSGKSTLLNALSGLEKADGGSIAYDGVDIGGFGGKRLTAFRRQKVGFVFQSYYLLPSLNVLNNIRMGAHLGGTKDVGGIIEAVGLTGKEKRFPHQLSGGERQRVSIARALAKDPEILFCDEPTGALDEATGRKILDCLLSLRCRGRLTLVMVTHNENIAALADRVVRMNSGRVVSVTTNTAPLSVAEIAW